MQTRPSFTFALARIHAPAFWPNWEQRSLQQLDSAAFSPGSAWLEKARSERQRSAYWLKRGSALYCLATFFKSFHPVSESGSLQWSSGQNGPSKGLVPSFPRLALLRRHRSLIWWRRLLLAANVHLGFEPQGGPEGSAWKSSQWWDFWFYGSLKDSSWD